MYEQFVLHLQSIIEHFQVSSTSLLSYSNDFQLEDKLLLFHLITSNYSKLRWIVNYIYFWFSLGFLILRTCYVFLQAASINDQAKSPILLLRQCNTHNWCVELERFIYQMSTERIALSGRKFYRMTRDLLFKVIGFAQ